MFSYAFSQSHVAYFKYSHRVTDVSYLLLRIDDIEHVYNLFLFKNFRWDIYMYVHTYMD